ncbi:hypothetical protein FG386_000576 [Cryptosporidium ryanae]|uniref:uncharacterized protein n=1 Tax=Cryptosporidium ryanae TaxID=515981 RepID=UPI00351A79B7|nr:hypothetical protein FG386_000576 [Cryptosporidium ryanae]
MSNFNDSIKGFVVKRSEGEVNEEPYAENYLNHNNGTFDVSSQFNNGDLRFQTGFSSRNVLGCQKNTALNAASQSQLYQNRISYSDSLVEPRSGISAQGYSYDKMNSYSLMSNSQMEDNCTSQKSTQNSAPTQNDLGSNLSVNKTSLERGPKGLVNSSSNSSSFYASNFDSGVAGLSNVSQALSNMSKHSDNYQDGSLCSDGLIKREKRHNSRNNDKLSGFVSHDERGGAVPSSTNNTTIHPIINKNNWGGLDSQITAGGDPASNNDSLTNSKVAIVNENSTVVKRPNLRLSSCSPANSSSSNTPVPSPLLSSLNKASIGAKNSNRINLDSSKNGGYNSFPKEKIVWDYLHLLHIQDKQKLNYLGQYVDDTFNIGKFHCMVTEYCKREKSSRDALIINARNWFKDFIDRKESESILAPNITTEEGIKRYVNKKLRHYLDLGFKFEQGIVDLYHELFVYIIKGIWERLEEASFDRVDWSLRPYLKDDEGQVHEGEYKVKIQKEENCDQNKKQDSADREHENQHDCGLVSHVMRLNEATNLVFTEKELGNGLCKTQNKSSQQNSNVSNSNQDKPSRNVRYTGFEKKGRTFGPDSKVNASLDDEVTDQVKEMIIVSRKQKWLLRNVRLSDFKHIIQMDDLYDKLPIPICSDDEATGNSLCKRIKLPKNIRRKLSEMICIHYSSVQ